MSDSDFLNPPIEVLATSPRREMIKSRLRAAGLRPYDIRDMSGSTDPLLIDGKSISNDEKA
ncbi:MAG: hypothetical protein AAGJ50_15845, partial [Pseudomonadota bacterium]